VLNRKEGLYILVEAVIFGYPEVVLIVIIQPKLLTYIFRNKKVILELVSVFLEPMLKKWPIIKQVQFRSIILEEIVAKLITVCSMITRQ